mgnify:FL=1
MQLHQNGKLGVKNVQGMGYDACLEALKSVVFTWLLKSNENQSDPVGSETAPVSILMLSQFSGSQNLKQKTLKVIAALLCLQPLLSLSLHLPHCQSYLTDIH